jgi:hypothetical protein
MTMSETNENVRVKNYTDSWEGDIYTMLFSNGKSISCDTSLFSKELHAEAFHYGVEVCLNRETAANKGTAIEDKIASVKGRLDTWKEGKWAKKGSGTGAKSLMSTFEANAITTAIKFKNVDLVESMLHGTKTTPERLAEIKEVVLEALTAVI